MMAQVPIHVSLENCDQEGINTQTSSYYALSDSDGELPAFLQWSILILHITVK